MQVINSTFIFLLNNGGQGLYFYLKEIAVSSLLCCNFIPPAGGNGRKVNKISEKLVFPLVPSFGDWVAP